MMEADLIVVGGGPAGLSAAVRAAWIGTLPSSSILPLRIVVLEGCASLGGLTRWQPVRTFAPHMFFAQPDLAKMVDWCIQHGVEIRHEEVVALSRAGDHMAVRTASNEYRCGALVIAAGMRRSFEAEPSLYRSRKLFFVPTTEDGFVATLVADLEERRGAGTVVVCGTERATAFFNAVRRAAVLSEVVCVAEPPYTKAPDSGVLRARVVNLSEEGGGVRVSLVEEASVLAQEKQAHAVIFDLESYERLGTALRDFGSLGLDVTSGFVHADRAMRTNVPGIFCAGDVSGPPFAVAKALSEGMVAGFSAYSYLHEQKTGHVPNLYPYVPLPT